MMEKLGAPQTYLGLKNMIKEVDEDQDGKISFREVQNGHYIKKSLKGGSVGRGAREAMPPSFLKKFN